MLIFRLVTDLTKLHCKMGRQKALKNPMCHLIYWNIRLYKSDRMALLDFSLPLPEGCFGINELNLPPSIALANAKNQDSRSGAIANCLLILEMSKRLCSIWRQPAVLITKQQNHVVGSTHVCEALDKRRIVVHPTVVEINR
ncbi:hypothetical protein WK54_26425 [Burkholderia ubonensis]|nr:hypothetical protein WK54_26425 [Burkholderia ubonensis]